MRRSITSVNSEAAKMVVGVNGFVTSAPSISGPEDRPRGRALSNCQVKRTCGLRRNGRWCAAPLALLRSAAAENENDHAIWPCRYGAWLRHSGRDLESIEHALGGIPGASVCLTNANDRMRM